MAAPESAAGTRLPGLRRQTRPLPGSLEWLVSFGFDPADTHDQRQLKRIVVGAEWVSLFTSGSFGVLYAAAGAPWAAFTLAALFAVVVSLLVALKVRPATWPGVIHVLVGANLAVIVAIALLFGGIDRSGSVIVWGFAGVLAGVIVFHDRRAIAWLGIYVAVTLGTAVTQGRVGRRYELPAAGFQSWLNMAVVAAFVSILMLHFVRQRDVLREESDGLLRNILPDEIVERLKESDGMIADHFDDASVLFADVVGFTPMSASMSPAETVELLNDVFSEFDRMVDAAGVEKIKTVGDEYMVAAGVPQPRPDHAHAAARLAIEMREFAERHEIRGRSLAFRIGINSGPVVAGIIGRNKFAYDLWGDAVNTASRMESHSSPGTIQISDDTHRLIRDAFECEDLGTIEVKGKGAMRVWLLIGAKQPAER